MEILDIVDENNNLTGEKIDRKIVHQKGLWHREIGILIINERLEILLQKRAATKKLCPNMWALCAGHIDAGEEPIIAAIRELQEEVGLTAKESEFIDLGIVKITKIHNDIINNHFKYMYLIKTNAKLEDYKIQYEELSELKYMPINELIEVIKSGDENYIFSNSKEIIELLENIDKYI